MEATRHDILVLAQDIILKAWSEIRHLHGQPRHVRHKPDGPVTEADGIAQRCILTGLEKHCAPSSYGVLSEELEDDLSRLERNRVWIVDPIDGTNDFLRGGDDFALQLALAERDDDGVFRPVVAVVIVPMEEVLYSAVRGGGATRVRLASLSGDPKSLRVSTHRELDSLTAVVSKSHVTRRLRATMQSLPVPRWYHRGSLGVKIIEVAQGHADLYLNTERGKCKEWDLCAPQLILEEAGGRLTDLDGEPITYNNKDVAIHGGVLATNGVCHDAVREALRAVLELRQS